MNLCKTPDVISEDYVKLKLSLRNNATTTAKNELILHSIDHTQDTQSHAKHNLNCRQIAPEQTASV
ncbi:hypothetical protein NIES2135_49560 [Leptolyngbya boryana NIES-2135]|jgi:hypothetical protein|uniref:Uncharacterized protein n=1 Tax=Leptolyngbya boryana NIES-2135 TaxID=1973484 RepID=A0A1Z4JN69_LEPBY|nr:hypothetical protein LBWT_16590 [Leptolyngbya boryana IAM M-101]BAS62102.1 hypothetical protein LBDG_16590 [Leptolyngbya boryana dg5]BAY58083.1 hypothetical protein NIES2135_49560 [Leptolyngbya boryana NIES-2135]